MFYLMTTTGLTGWEDSLRYPDIWLSYVHRPHMTLKHACGFVISHYFLFGNNPPTEFGVEKTNRSLCLRPTDRSRDKDRASPCQGRQQYKQSQLNIIHHITLLIVRCWFEIASMGLLLFLPCGVDIFLNVLHLKWRWYHSDSSQYNSVITFCSEDRTHYI